MESKKTRAPGAGVKADDGAKNLSRSQISIDHDSEEARILLRIGNDNLSLGIREAARRLKEHGDTKPFSLARHRRREK